MATQRPGSDVIAIYSEESVTHVRAFSDRQKVCSGLLALFTWGESFRFAFLQLDAETEIICQAPQCDDPNALSAAVVPLACKSSSTTDSELLITTILQ